MTLSGLSCTPLLISRMTDSVARIVRPILVPLGLSFVLFLSAFLLGINWLGSRYISNHVDAAARSIEQAYTHGIDSLAHSLDGYLYLILKSGCMHEAWKSGDRQELSRCTSPLYPEMHSQFDVVDLAFYTAGKKTLLSFLHPELFGTSADESFTLARVHNTGEASFGLNLSRSGMLMLRAVRPYLADGRLLGFVEMGVRVERLLENLSGAYDVGLTVLVNKEHLNHEGLEQGVRELVSEGLDGLVEHVAIINITEELGAGLIQFLDSDDHGGEIEQFRYKKHDRRYSATHIPLIDEAGSIIGKLAVVKDITYIHDSFEMIFIVSSLILAAVGSMLFLLLRGYLGTRQRHLINLYGVLQDEVEDRRSAELASRRLASAVEHSGSMVVITDSEGSIEYVNPRFSHVTGYSSQEVLGENPRILKSGENPQLEYDQLWETIKVGKHWYGELLNRKKSGELYWAAVSISPVSDEKDNTVNFVAVSDDITKKKESLEEMERLAFHDPLTGLPNRRLMLSHMEQILLHIKRDGGIAAMFFMDLDRFKQINDEMGHDAGDELLNTVAWRLTSTLRGQDVVGRLGGDEFLVLLPNIVHIEDAEIVAKKILHVMSEPISLRGQEIIISFSIGIAIAPQDGDDVEMLLKLADEAMYRAKETGRNAYVFY